jgi:hypothetical protein
MNLFTDDTNISDKVRNKEPVEKLIFFRLVKNAQMQGARNPEE